MTGGKERTETHHFLVAHDGSVIKDSVAVDESDLLSLGIEPAHCNPALLIHGLTYLEIERKELLSRRNEVRKELFEFIERADKNSWYVDYVASWLREIELLPGRKRAATYKHRIADLTGHGEYPCD